MNAYPEFSGQPVNTAESIERADSVGSRLWRMIETAGVVASEIVDGAGNVMGAITHKLEDVKESINRDAARIGQDDYLSERNIGNLRLSALKTQGSDPEASRKYRKLCLEAKFSYHTGKAAVFVASAGRYMPSRAYGRAQRKAARQHSLASAAYAEWSEL